jgi:hypothetical protein
VTYDAAGNIINDGVHSYTYDAEYRITKVDSGSTATYLYDAFGRRAQRIVGVNTYDELYDLGGNVAVELTPSGAVQDYEVFTGGRHLATYASNSTISRTLTGWARSGCVPIPTVASRSPAPAIRMAIIRLVPALTRAAFTMLAWSTIAKPSFIIRCSGTTIPGLDCG